MCYRCEEVRTYDKHQESTSNQRLAATKVLNNIQTTESADEVDSTQDGGSDEAVANADRIEDGGSIIEEKVGTGQLLQSLKDHC